jgi:signal recognition particle subunit SEC65
MAKLLYTWTKVQRGDIISFVYQNKEGRRLRRTILVLEPKLKNLVHGIQLEVSNIPTNPEIKKILESAGKTEIVDEDKKIYRVELDGKTQNVYKKLKTLIKRHGIYRTYSYDKARKSSVLLEDLKLPTQFLKELKDED